MVFKLVCSPVLWRKLASALEGLICTHCDFSEQCGKTFYVFRNTNSFSEVVNRMSHDCCLTKDTFFFADTGLVLDDCGQFHTGAHGEATPVHDGMLTAATWWLR